MINFAEYKRHFSQQIKWCEDQIKSIKSSTKINKEKSVCKIQEYKRDCHVCCRTIDVISKKYKDLSDIPNDLYMEIQRDFFYIRFRKTQMLSEYSV